MHESPWKAGRKGEPCPFSRVYKNDLPIFQCSHQPLFVFLCGYLWFLCSLRRPVIEVPTASSWKRFWKTTTQHWCQRGTQAGMWASLREGVPAVAPTHYPTSRTYTSWSASRLGSSLTSPPPSASPLSASGARGCVLLGPASSGQC